MWGTAAAKEMLVYQDLHTYGFGGKGGWLFLMLRDQFETSYPTRLHKFPQLLSLWVRSRGHLYDVSFGGWPYQSKKECKKCGSMSACENTDKHTHAHAQEHKTFCITALYLTYLNSQTSFGVKKDLKP